MASTDAGRELTEQHRRQQLAIKAATTAATLELWPLLDPERLDATAPAWVAANERLIAAQDRRSQRTASAYFQTFAAAETGRLYEPLATVPLNTERVRETLLITGPVRLKSLMSRGHTLDRAATTTRVLTAGEAAKLALGGHRQMLVDSLNATYADNPPPIGWARVTDGDPCSFCAMLSGRGPVYRSAETAVTGRFLNARGDGFRAHPHCGCTAEPVFHRDAEWPGRSREFHDQWNQAQREARDAGELRRGTSNDALNAFRRFRSRIR